MLTLFLKLKYEKVDLNRFNKKRKSRPRHSRIMWFNPPYDEWVRTNVIQRMFAALERCYPRGHRLHKIFNRHTIKASYRTLANMSKQIAIHNSIIIKDYNTKLATQQTPQPRVPFPPGPPQQPAPPPGPPVTRSMSARAASLTPPTLATPALAPARASSNPSSAALNNNDINSPATTKQSSQPLPPLPPEIPDNT